MKKIVLILFAICLANHFKAQTGILDGNTYSSPAAASVPTLVKNPVSVASGIPDVGFPLFTLPTHSKDIVVNAGIRYHPNNTFQSSGATEIGLGWGIIGAHCVVYNELEAAGRTDNYYFTFLGRNGRFKAAKDVNNNWFVKKLTQNKLGIEITADASNEISKYTITDELGYKFIFDKQDKARLSGAGVYTGAYYLSAVRDPGNNELLQYEYIEDNYNTSPPGNPIQVMAKNLKLSKIISHDFGSINFEYSFDSAQRNTYNDPFKLTYAILKNSAGKEIQKFGFQYQDIGYEYPLAYAEGGEPVCQTQHLSKRALYKLLKYSNSGSYETTEFGYGNYFLNNAWTEGIYQLGCLKNEFLNPKHFAPGVLISTKLPTGSEVRYEYEPNEYYVNKNTSNYLQYYAAPEDVNDRDAQYYEFITTIPFDSRYFNVFNLSPNPDNQNGPSYLAYWYHVDEYFNNDLSNTSNTTPTANQYVKLKINGVETYSDTRVKCNPGMNNIEILGTGGKGTLTIMRIRYKTTPLANFSTGKGVRIKNIDYYDNGVLNPTLSRKYYYNRFDNSTITSGFLNDFDNNNSVVYKNIKEVVGNNIGYTKHYFMTVGDFIENLNPDGSLKNYALKYTNIMSAGLPLKTEIYDNNNTLLTSEENGYDFHEIPSFADFKPAIIKKHIVTSKNITSSGTISHVTETVRDTRDFNVTYKKTTAPDGVITEESYTYPWSQVLTNPRLYNAGIKDIPLTSEIKSNGTIISKTEIKFDDTSHFYPTSQASFLPDNLSQSLIDVSFDIYDDKGNPVQVTALPDTGSGVSTTVIYGYNKTLPIAKIVGAKLSDIPAHLINAIVNASNEDAIATPAQEEAKEQALIAALNSFKNDAALQNFLITCYTYNPLVGITTTIPPNGQMELYKYDSFNRLLKVIDVNGNTVKEHQYNYKN